MKSPIDAERAAHSEWRAGLMRRMQLGEAEACRELFDDVGPALARFLRRRIADAHELEDVYQEVLLAVFEARHTYDPIRPFEPWLFAIARNIAVDHLRRGWRRARWEELVADPPERAAHVSNAAPPALEEALGQLPREQREAFAMLKLDGLSLAQAAESAGVSVGALKVRAHRAYKTLRRVIGG